MQNDREEKDMGLDLYIEARIKEKETGRVISYGSDDPYVEEETRGFFEICWWCGWDCCDIRDKMIEICNSHAGTGYTNSDFKIPIPPSALRDIYAYIVNRCYLSDDEPFGDIQYEEEWYEWEERRTYERANLTNADKLFDLIRILEEIKYLKYMPDYRFLYKENISNESDLRRFVDNPLAYEWEFRIWNSY